jgi:AcrR family transcriptional regulator
MNHTIETRSDLLQAAQALFSQRGFDGTSIRAITRKARANLGAVTYHFGSKEALYEAVVDGLANPLREAVAQAAQTPGAPLDRIDAVVHAFFAYLRDHPELPRLMIQQLASERPMPVSAQRALQANHGAIAALIAEGQRDGTIRGGDARLMVLSIVPPIMLLTLLQAPLRDAIAIDQRDPATWERVVDSVVTFARAGLRPDEVT